MRPLTLPSRRARLSQSKPLFASFDGTFEHSPEHFVELSTLVEAETDVPPDQIFSQRWLDLCWPFEEQDYDDAGLIFEGTLASSLV